MKKLRSELSSVTELKKLKRKVECVQKSLQDLKNSSSKEINIKQELSDERVANRALSEKLEKDLVEVKKALQVSDHEKSRLQIQLEDRDRKLKN